ncbi:hypothetical protein [Roseobacter sinensis]|uniref:Uncharacterized protein n=1 Tax=Roseobacter sinensis TaxID=2931391 RepID=A0ABT3BFR1_9RHOB|nr:hypothetical protein [Roseobacter sp. WL0113]MCV3272425.1 hypothetical protein [Roseobacter sp. WL0113]
MNVIKTAEIARALYHAHGDKAELEAAQRERTSKEAGNHDEAQRWRTIRGSIRQLRGANQS